MSSYFKNKLIFIEILVIFVGIKFSGKVMDIFYGVSVVLWINDCVEFDICRDDFVGIG